MTTRQNLLTPVGRLVRGSLYRGNDKDAEGRPLVVKSGPNAGQARLDFFFALAIPKGPEAAWWDTEWGKVILSVGAACFPRVYTTPSFSWKVTDGDSQVPNKRGRKPCENEGYPGNWVVGFSSGFAPKIFNKDGTAPIVEPDAVKLGYYIQVFGSVDGNGSDQQPGVFLNHSMVSLQAYGTEIVVGPDAAAVGFGGAALPAGASATPPAGAFAGPAQMPAQMPAMPGTPAAMPAMPSMAPGAAVAMPAMPGAPTVVTPNPAILTPPAPPAPPAAPARRMTAAAGGYSYDDLIRGGWTDATLIAQGLMLP